MSICGRIPIWHPVVAAIDTVFGEAVSGKTATGREGYNFASEQPFSAIDC
jgi:hypothetical protein